MSVDDGFVTAVGPDGKKRRVPKHYLDHPRFGYKLPASARAQEPATPANTTVTEPAKRANQKEVTG